MCRIGLAYAGRAGAQDGSGWLRTPESGARPDTLAAFLEACGIVPSPEADRALRLASYGLACQLLL
jgi:hypothetical protein